MYSRLLAVTGAVAGSLIWASAAGASTITLEAGTGAPSSVVAFSSSSNGSLSATTTGGGFSTIQINAAGINLPQLLNTQLDGTTLPGGTLNFWVTEIGLTAPLGSIGFLSSFALNPAGTSDDVTVVENTFLSAADTAFGTATALGSATCTLSGCVPLTGSATGTTGPGAYSVTEEFSITSTYGDKVDATINLDPPAAPIPGTLPLFASGLAGFWAWSRKRKAKAQLPSPSVE
jgi:hypothetical protein